jgi:ketol-acid reductoisomerase
MKISYDDAASLAPLEDKTIAIVGYGNQGRSQALNLRDCGLKVIVGNRDDTYGALAREDGFETTEIPEAASAADVLLILTTDESQPVIWEQQVAPGLRAGDTLVWASGYNIGYDLIKPPAEVDVVMVAPRMPGEVVRTLFEQGGGAMAQIAVHQDVSGGARDTMMAVAKGIGCTRGGVFESSFREEAELDLFAEQVVWPGLVAWIEESFQLGVDNGFSPQLLALELYASGESSHILGLMARYGFYKQMTRHSTTSQYGTLSRAPRMLNDENRARMSEHLLRDIKGGAFAKEWSEEQATGGKTLDELRKKALMSPMSLAEGGIIKSVQRSVGSGS